MHLKKISSLLCTTLLSIIACVCSVHAQNGYARDPHQAVDEDYTRKIAEYTTEKFFNSPLTDYLPASPNVPTPKAVLGDVAGAPGKLPYSADVYKYMRLLEKASPRVKVFSIGTTEEGREMIAVAIASESLLAKLDENRARLTKLADPRLINLNDAEADKLVDESFPIYYITGTIHSPETGAPTALMELAYRLAVDDSPYVKSIRDGMVTLITPIVEVDGRDRMVDVYNWHLAHPGENWPPLLYWGHYVAHDNNRDAMGLSLKLTRNVLNTYISWKPQVLHDLHESVPYLYDNTIGDGPYNAWVDPILTDEWQLIGWNNVSEMTKFGMPGVFAHGTFDTWSPGYLMFIAATHNGISRLYETFGNAGADTLVRTLSPDEYQRTWYKQNPPLPRAKWSQRNNNNYEQTAILISLDYFNKNSKLFLKNFYLKSKRSVEKPKTEGPAAYVFPADDSRPGNQAALLRLMQAQGCEVHRATAAFTVTMKKKATPRARGTSSPTPTPASSPAKKDETESRTFPAGTYLVRMDQPYSRIADALLDYQYWSPRDPQTSVYDDTGWTFGEVSNVQVVRVTDVKALDAPMEKVNGEVQSPGGIKGHGGDGGTLYAINQNADNNLVTLRFRLKNSASFEVTEEPFEVAGQKFNRGSFLVRIRDGREFEKALADLGVTAWILVEPPKVKTHALKLPRIAIMHTWLNTQDEGWWRLAFDQMGVAFDYISTQDVAKDPDLNKKYDVIVFGPGNGNMNAVIQGRPMYGNPIPWKTTPQTPNIGKIDSTDDIRPGLGWTGLMNLQNFVRRGGVLIGADDSASFAVQAGFTPGVSIQSPTRLRAIGDILKTRMVDAASPIAYGYGDTLSVYCFNGPIFNVSNVAGGGGGRRGGAGQRATGRGTVDDPDVVQGRPPVELPEPPPQVEVWEAAPVQEEQRRNLVGLIPPDQRPRVILRWGNTAELLVSGLLDGGDEIAQHAAVIDSPLDRGHVILFSNNPFWRGQTAGSYALVWNAIMNFDNLNAGRKPDEK
jgi:zinc carboxypeptidase